MLFFGFLICEVVGVDPYGSILAEPSHVNEKSNRTGQEKLLAKTSRKIGVWIVSLLVCSPLTLDLIRIHWEESSFFFDSSM